MAKRVILAVAGSGKTYHICHQIDPNKKNLILAYTNENVKNIKRELHNAYGHIPELTTISTFDSFVYNNMILPYEPSIGAHFGLSNFYSNGISTKEPPNITIKKNGKTVPNPKYIKKNEIGHYLTNKDYYYCSRLSKLILTVNKKQTPIIKRIAKRLDLFYDRILIDEFQDFREDNYDLIIKLSKHINKNIILVGDYYQHSVSAINNSGKPFKNKNLYITYDDFVKSLQELGFEVDLTTLDKSRRCSPEICSYITEKLDINIISNGNNLGSVKWVNDNDVNRILEDQTITKLVFNNAKSYSFNALNWSYSKGDTFNSTCVILTDKFENLSNPDFSKDGLSIITLNKLYVAMTRSCGDLYLIKASTFKKVKKNYIVK